MGTQYLLLIYLLSILRYLCSNTVRQFHTSCKQNKRLEALKSADPFSPCLQNMNKNVMLDQGYKTSAASQWRVPITRPRNAGFWRGTSCSARWRGKFGAGTVGYGLGWFRCYLCECTSNHFPETRPFSGYLGMRATGFHGNFIDVLQLLFNVTVAILHAHCPMNVSAREFPLEMG